MIFTSDLPDLDIPKVSIIDYLFAPNKELSDQPLWIDATDNSHYLSSRTALQWIKRLGFGMQRLGINCGDACVIFTPNHIYVPIAYLGFVAFGAAFSGLNPTYTVQEMVYQLKTVEAKMVLVHPALIETATAAASQAGISKDRLFLFSDKYHEPIEGVKDWRAMIGTEEEGASWTWKSLSPEESLSTIATVNFSSGTTGLPKGVCITHRNIISNVEQIEASIAFTDKEHWVGFLPFYHAYGQAFTILMVVKLNIPVTVMSAFDLEKYLQIIQDHRITRLQVVPPILILLTKRPEVAKYDLSSVKEIRCGGAPLSSELETAVQQRFKTKVVQGWGMTELTTGGITPVPGFDTPGGSVGRLIPNMEVKLVDEDGKEVSKPHTPGEIYVRGPMVALGYWRNEEATRESFAEGGWFKSGDVATFNEDGFFWIVDRKKELIKVNGLQVSPAELEMVLLENDDIADAAVVGVTVYESEWPRAYVVLKPEKVGGVSELQIQEWIKPRVAKHKALRGGVALVPEIPKLASGKILRKTIKEWSKRDAKELERKTDFQAKL